MVLIAPLRQYAVQFCSNKAYAIARVCQGLSFRKASPNPNMNGKRLSSTTTPASPDLFEYTSGRWIFNEEVRRSERRLTFSIDALKEAIAQSVDRPTTEIVSFEKLAEGGFNRILEARFRDGKVVLARLPYPLLAPKHYAIASEAATLAFLQSQDLPVPKVLGYSSTHENPVGTEYLLLEKIDGVCLGNIWYIIDNKARKKIMQQVVDIEEKMIRFSLPASGSIYHFKDLRPGDRHVSLAQASTQTTGPEELVIGPTAQYEWHYKERTSMKDHNGPWNSFLECFQAPAQRELEWCRKHGKPRLHVERHLRHLDNFCEVQPETYANALTDYLKLAPSLDVPADHVWSRPVLRHPDLSPSNILISEDNEIVGLIDWQHARVLPLCLAAGIPKHFQNWGDPESEKMSKPVTSLPDDYDSLSPQEKGQVLETQRRRLVHFLYAAKTMVQVPEHFKAMRHSAAVLRARLYQHVTWPWEGNSVDLKHDLANVVESWPSTSDLTPGAASRLDPEVIVGECPLDYPKAYIEQCKKDYMQQEEQSEEVGEMREALDIDQQGWVSDDEHWEKSRSLAQMIKASLLEDCETEVQKRSVVEHFPFDDHDED